MLIGGGILKVYSSSKVVILLMYFFLNESEANYSVYQKMATRIITAYNLANSY